MSVKSTKIYVALPVLDEFENLPRFIECFAQQSWTGKKLVVCVNQPDDWWELENKKSICINNQKSLQYLQHLNPDEIEVIDRSSKGQGWTGKNYGVGWARKVSMDRIAAFANPHDILISLDADTTFNAAYFESVFQTLSNNPRAVALSVPYFHRLTGDEVKDRAILHYEIYMRYYAINLWRIQNPYAFTAVGSAMALPVQSYRAIGGITPHKSGEDFYFLQKLRKYGMVLTYNPEKVYPAARYSTRVGFGTGPAMIKGSAGDWKSYPVYPHALFDEVKQTTDAFARLFETEMATPMDTFNTVKFGEKNIWDALRRNYKSADRFIHACHHKIDALRILQYLKWRHQETSASDEQNLTAFMAGFYPEQWRLLNIKSFSFTHSPVQELHLLRTCLLEIEQQYQINYGR